jgi:hypothetical protein
MRPTTLPIGFATAILGVTLAAYVCALAWLSPLVLEDNPNHLARAVALSDLLFQHGRRYGAFFRFDFLVTPNLLPDLILATLTFLLGSARASAAWAAIVFISLPCALLLFLSAKRVPKDVILLMLLLSAYFGTDAFFLMGFVAFRFSVSLVLVVLALTELLRRRWSIGILLCFWLCVAAAYLTHFAAIVFIGLFLGISIALRIIRRVPGAVRESYLLLPVACAVGWHLLIARHYRRADDLFAQTLDWGNAGAKFVNLLWEVSRYRERTDLLLAALLFVTLLLWNRAGDRANDVPAPDLGTTKSAVAYASVGVEGWLFVLVLLGFYFAMPIAYSEGGYVDVRALAFVPVFATLGAACWPSGRERSSIFGGKLVAFICAAVLVLVNLIYLTRHLHADGVRMALYRALIKQIPEHARVLPIYTGGFEGVAQPFRHAASFAVVDRAALIPYLFTGDVGAPQTYFRYVDRPYAPDDMWYVALRSRDSGIPLQPDENPDVDWRRVSQTYDYLLVWKPVVYSQIRVEARVVAQNDAAALLRIAPWQSH